VRKAVLLIALFVGACQLKKVEPDSSTVRSREANKELQSFKDEVCPAALNGLRAVTEDRVMNPENFKDTTVLMDLREAAAMLDTVMVNCLRTSSPTPDTTSNIAPAPDSILEEPKKASSVRIALSPSSALPTAR